MGSLAPAVVAPLGLEPRRAPFTPGILPFELRGHVPPLRHCHQGRFQSTPIQRRKGIRGIFMWLPEKVKGKPSSSGRCRAVQRTVWGSDPRTGATSAGVRNSLSLAFISSRVIGSLPFPAMRRFFMLSSVRGGCLLTFVKRKLICKKNLLSLICTIT